MSELDTEMESSIRTEVQQQLDSPEVLDSWTDDLAFRRAKDDRLEICLRNATQARYFEKRFGELFRSAVRDVLGNEVSLVIHGEPEGDTESTSSKRRKPTSEQPNGSTSNGHPPGRQENGTGSSTATAGGRSRNGPTESNPTLPGYDPSLREDYRFEQFVVGPCNRLAHAACLSVLEQPARAYNPLFIHGPVGLGKSHLLQALCHAYLEDRDERRTSGDLLYLPCETFVNLYINGICNESIDSVRSRLRKVDLLVIDDIHFLANKSGSQEEFFHTFNALYNAHSQIVLSSDCPPDELPSIEDRLMSRFKWGLTTSLEEPAQDTSLAIVERKLKESGVDVPPDVRSYIARISSSVREMEGAISAVSAAVRFGDDDTISLDETRELLGRTDPVPTNHSVSVPDILDRVSSFFEIDRDRLTSGDQSKEAADARHVAIYLSSQLTNLSQSEIGAYFGVQNHSSVHYAVNKIEDRIQEKKRFRRLVDHLKEDLGARNVG